MTYVLRGTILSAAVAGLVGCSQRKFEGARVNSSAPAPLPTMNSAAVAIPQVPGEIASVSTVPSIVPQRCGTVASAMEASLRNGNSLSGLAPQELVEADIESLKSLDPAYDCGFAKYDRSHGNAFSAIFGGANRASVVNFLNTRIRYYYSPEDIMEFDIRPAEFRDLISDVNPRRNKNSRAVIGAANIGTSLWLESLAAGVTVTLSLGRQTIIVDSSRVGLIEIGPGYTADLRGSNVAIPPVMRISTLLHEARHSDCTGGVTKADLNHDTRSPSFQCGHLHIICPSGDYKGLPACDGMPWGAYTVGMIWEEAILATLSGPDRQLMEAHAIDNRSRLMFDADQMLAGGFGPPDMSSEGLK